ncbi:MAG: nitrous oxide-stimulated promoter family protein [Paludibacteraceae bacterium]
MSSIKYEIATIEKMIHIYCRKKHSTAKGRLCETCNSMLAYATTRLTKCPFGDEKGACADCKIHCYNKQKREEMREIMRFSGPRMLIYYPKDFLLHIFVDRKKKKR